MDFRRHFLNKKIAFLKRSRKKLFSWVKDVHELKVQGLCFSRILGKGYMMVWKIPSKEAIFFRFYYNFINIFQIYLQRVHFTLLFPISATLFCPHLPLRICELRLTNPTLKIKLKRIIRLNWLWIVSTN